MTSQTKKTHFGFKEVERKRQGSDGAWGFFISRFKI